MAAVATYLNFARSTEKAFDFYSKIFGTTYTEPIRRFRDIPAAPGMPPLPESVADLVMHVSLPILGGHLLLGTDAPPEMGFQVVQGNNSHICLTPDSPQEAEHLYRHLSEGGEVEMPLQEQFWGALFASFSDRFGVKWMINLPLAAGA